MKNNMVFWTFFPIIFSLVLFTTDAYAEGIIKEVAVDTAVIDLASGSSSADITFSLTEPCTLNLFICTTAGEIVRNLITAEEMSAGEHTKSWDGVDDNFKAAANGLYFPIIQCKSKKKGAFTYDPSAHPWGEEVPAQNFSYNNGGKELSFEIDRPAYARLRVGLKDGGPVYRTLAPWRLWQAGPHRVQWNGKDKRNTRSVLNKEKLSYSFDSFTVPENSIVVVNPKPAMASAGTNLKKYPINPPRGGRLSYFALEADSQGEELELAVILKTSQKDWKGKTVIKGEAVYGVDFVDFDKKSSTIKPGSELIIYVDDLYVAEHPIDNMPATIAFDSTKFKNGKHEVTINVMVTDDRAGIWQDTVLIKN